MKRLHWNAKCEKPMMAMPILSLDYLSTNVKGHNDISIESPAQPVFFPGRLQSDLFQYTMHPFAHAYLTQFTFCITSLPSRPVACPATRNVAIFASESVAAASSCQLSLTWPDAWRIDWRIEQMVHGEVTIKESLESWAGDWRLDESVRALSVPDCQQVSRTFNSAKT